MKKIISLLVTVVLLVSVTIPASALSFQVNITPEKKAMKKGTEQTITIGISDINVEEGESLSSVGINLVLSEGLELVSGETNKNLPPITEKDATLKDESDDTTFEFKFTQFDVEKQTAVLLSSDLNGDLLTITVRAKEDIGEQSVEATITPSSTKTPISEDCSIKVKQYDPGDVNGDGKVNNRDCARLIQSISGWNVEYVDEARDTNGDGKVNNRDYARLMQSVSGWNVDLY
ncbi:MAG: hypothetical protein IJJ40_03465 [Clostridia bacterium]|nr:hypothetical protein [Clostridia bacterium]